MQNDLYEKFRAVAKFPGTILLHSGKGESRSILAHSPTDIFSAKNDPDTFTKLRAFLSKNPRGFFAGYFSYDLAYLLAPIRRTVKDDLRIPDIWLCRFDNVEEYKNAPTQWQTAQNYKPPTTHHPLLANFSKRQYGQAFTKIKQYISSGDTYQINLSQRFSAQTKIPPDELFLKLEAANPAEQSAFLNCGDFQIISASPERFLKVENGIVITAPIKGTRPRFPENPARDNDMLRELLDSKKDEAELNMITDLLRNDLGRTAIPKSVRVLKNRAVLQCPTVWHTYSEITARLNPRYDLIDLIETTFPGGSITGCPKIRAMEIIDELEPTARGIYTGSIGYIDLRNLKNPKMDLNIAIRTILNINRRKSDQISKVYFQVGGGVVADSECEAEYQETLDKASALMDALNLVEAQRADTIPVPCPCESG